MCFPPTISRPMSEHPGLGARAEMQARSGEPRARSEAKPNTGEAAAWPEAKMEAEALFADKGGRGQKQSQE